MSMPLVCSIRARLAVIASTASEIRSSSRRLRALSPGSFDLAPSSGQLPPQDNVFGCLRGGAAHARTSSLPGPGAMENAAYTRRRGPPTCKPRARAGPVEHARPRRHRTRRASKQGGVGRCLRNVHNHADAAPRARYPGRSATSVTVSEPVNTRRPLSALASMTERKAVEPKKFGHHCKAYEFEP
jgi:hypothetical protein